MQRACIRTAMVIGEEENMAKIGLVGIVLTGIASLLNNKRRELCIGVYENGQFREVY